MAKVQRKEYYESQVTRTRSPAIIRGSAQDLTEFDHNLDYLLEDLQSSVAKSPAIGNSNTYREARVTRDVDHGRSRSLNRVTHLKASNPVTEFSSDDSYNYVSPDGTRSMKSIKKEAYSYSTGHVGPEKQRMQNNIDQLDSLLDDLKQVKQGVNNSAGTDAGLVKERVILGKRTVERELTYGDTPPKTTTLERSQREGSMTREIQYIDEGTYGETRPIRYTPPLSASQTSTLTKQKKVTNVHSYPLQVVETSTPDINPEILANLEPNLLPTGNTKVTTTIKTYTYEIPGTGYRPVGTSPEPDRYVYSPTTPSKSFVYNKGDDLYPSRERTLERNVYKESSTKHVQPYQRPTSPTGGETIIKETTTTRNYQPGYQVDSPPSKQTYIYNESTTTRNINEYPERPLSRDGPRSDVYIHKETHNTTAKPYQNGYPPQEPGSKTIIYKHDTHTTNYTQPSRQPPPATTVIHKTETTENYDGYPRGPGGPHGARGPHDPRDPRDVNITYKYSTHSSSTNKYGGYPDESEPLLRPQPFPTGGADGPPKRVDELMATIGNEPPDSPLNSGFQAHEVELVHQRKVDTLKHQQAAADDLQKKERNMPPTKNISGPAVYYPPGHEMFARKEESGGAWRAEGAMARESGKYKYEAESGSKTTTKTKAAIVPVCLPLCCGLPCTIM